MGKTVYREIGIAIVAVIILQVLWPYIGKLPTLLLAAVAVWFLFFKKR